MYDKTVYPFIRVKKDGNLFSVGRWNTSNNIIRSLQDNLRNRGVTRQIVGENKMRWFARLVKSTTEKPAKKVWERNLMEKEPEENQDLQWWCLKQETDMD